MKPYRQAGWKNGRPVFVRQAIGRALRDVPAPAVFFDEISLDRMNKPSCTAIRDGQEVYCPTCALRWSLDEDRPECPR